MTSTETIAEFVAEVTYDRLPEEVREAAKRRLLDGLAVGLGSHGDGPVAAIRDGLATDGNGGACRVWGSPSIADPSRAAMANAAAVAAGNGPVFPSSTPAPMGGSIAAALAAAEARGTAGEETIAGLAAALELRGELAWHAPLDGLHPATHTAVAAAAGAGRAAGLEEKELADAVGIAASRVTLGVGTENEDGDGGLTPVATANAAAAGVKACSLAGSGVHGPDGFAAPNGWHDRLGPFELDFDPGCERVRDAATLPYDGGLYAQPAIEAAIDLASEIALDPADVESVAVETVGGEVPGVDAERIAAALVDRSLPIYRGDRADLSPIAEATSVSVADGASDRTDAGRIPARVAVETYDGGVYEATTERFEGHPAAPASWGLITEKFHALAGDRYDRDRREAIVGTVRGFEAESPAELARLLD
ncbi:MmgE/PrpD family protein [Natronomonas sp. F2-12]|jgi:2-methylcitrate dehydratase|uniref:MmgE/PrpD family protein n=1 Tax=Natronomonas aquatica TaxID=2841590 RepID=A0A9R1D3S6_9EURY|nr:MmgE/PrpD family protein [Natronomonas aquatica]MCQ4332624.1 MmgE/PrpD family protein [Natronomonas aquatica]